MICFIALDGTDESEMICFGDVARQIVGKPVQQLLRIATSGSPLPADVTRIVSRRFTFALTLTQQTYYRQDKTFQVTSVVAAHGQRGPVMPVASNGSGTPPGSGGQAPTGSTVHTPPSVAATDKAVLPPLSVLEGDPSPALLVSVSRLFHF